MVAKKESKDKAVVKSIAIKPALYADIENRASIKFMSVSGFISMVMNEYMQNNPVK